jgi:hypothetical protein
MISVREAPDRRRATDSGRQGVRIRDVQPAGPAFMSVEMALENLEMAVSLDFSHFQQIGWK